MLFLQFCLGFNTFLLQIKENGAELGRKGTIVGFCNFAANLIGCEFAEFGSVFQNSVFSHNYAINVA